MGPRKISIRTDGADYKGKIKKQSSLLQERAVQDAGEGAPLRALLFRVKTKPHQCSAFFIFS
jgi:hypothetical protein